MAAPLSTQRSPSQALARPSVAALARPVTGLFLARRRRPYVLNADAARDLARAALRRGGARTAARSSLPPTRRCRRNSSMRSVTRYLPGSDPGRRRPAARAVGLRRPLHRDRRRRRDARRGLPDRASPWPCSSCRAGTTICRWCGPWRGPCCRLLGGETYRGTPLQQSVPGRVVDWLTTRGLAVPAARPGRALSLARSARPGDAARCRGAGRGAAAARRSATQVVARVRNLLSEISQPI